MQALLDSLPYKLTEDQHRAVYGMLNTMASGRRLDALLQGDVGSGKTICAAILISAVIDSGYQAALMAPTSVLASQHYKEFASYFPGRTVFLGSKLKAKERRTILSSIKDGSASLIIGTHAAIASDIEYANLALTVVDEEHRFGVAQRELLQEKAQAGAHVLSMSATPIPRSLALAVHGESTVIYDIHTMPAGRKPVKTIVFRNKDKTYASLYNQIKAGHQGYIVCPIIESNDKVEGVTSITETEDALRKFFAGTDVRISCIHGAMKPTAIEDEISKFAAGQSDILLSTTIVEVGVNVPNATVMIIQNAERFGLAQLHQLRGRVCRGSAQGYCVLLSDDISNPRLQIMARTTDGFEVAKSDLELRGAGNLIGTEQSGFDRAVEIIATNHALYQEVVNSI
jgi:ATP-dependent DNA helicase RecG